MKPDSKDFTFGSPDALAREIAVEIETTILQLVVDGFERWRAGEFRRFGDHEDHYTVRLYQCMREISRERNLALTPIYRFVEPSEGMLDGDEDPTRAGCIDMVVSWNSFIDDAYLSIECKRLAPNDLARLYVVCGIDRFVRGFYGAKAQIGAMVGYVVSGTASAVLSRVNYQVERAPSMGKEHLLVSAGPIGCLETVFSSNHRRSSPYRSIRLTHLFFDMNEI